MLTPNGRVDAPCQRITRSALRVFHRLGLPSGPSNRKWTAPGRVSVPPLDLASLCWPGCVARAAQQLNLDRDAVRRDRDGWVDIRVPRPSWRPRDATVCPGEGRADLLEKNVGEAVSVVDSNQVARGFGSLAGDVTNHVIGPGNQRV